MDTLEKVLPRTIFLTVAGSHLYGTNIEGSDYDFKGVCVPTEDYYFGWLKQFEQLDRKVANGHPHDLVIVSLQKFAKLAVDCNPNIIELLFADDASIVHCDEYGEALREKRDAFLSKRARFTFAGYAHAQLKRIQTHYKWLLDPPKVKPTRAEFRLSETAKISKAELGAFDLLEKDGKTADFKPEVLTLFLRERQYQSALRTFHQYEQWKATRNEARASLEAKFGYDTKHAMHLVRLMRMCREILQGKGVVVKRPDAEELLDIRRGAWSYDALVERSCALETECAQLYESSPLPREPDRKALDEFVIQLTQRYLRR